MRGPSFSFLLVLQDVPVSCPAVLHVPISCLAMLDFASLDVSICLLAIGGWGVDRLVVWCLANVRVCEL